MINYKIISLGVSLLYCIQGFGQYGKGTMYDRKRQDAFPEPLQYKMTGWYFSPGFTVMPPQTFTLVTDAIKKSSEGPGSKAGIFLELGRYKIFEYPGIFRYYDYGLAYKSLRGYESKSGGTFGDHFISLHFNLNNTINISSTSFLSNTLGINVDYAFLRFNSGAAPSAFVAQLHYKLGIGFKVSRKLMIIPAIETPILNFFPFEYGNSSLGYLSSRYRPMIISIRFLILRPKMDECPYVPPPPGGLPTEDGNNGGME